MKKTGLIIMVIAGMILTAGQHASARGGNANGGKGDCRKQGIEAQHPLLNEETKAKIKAFRTENRELQKSMRVTMAEMRALMQADNPEPKMAGELAAKLFDIRTELQTKADEAGIGDFVGQGCHHGGHHGNYKRQGRGEDFRHPCPKYAKP